MHARGAAALPRRVPRDLRSNGVRVHAPHCVFFDPLLRYSLGCRDIEADVLPCARALGVAVVAYSPLARGLLAGLELKDLHPNDWRHCVRCPRRSAARSA